MTQAKPLNILQITDIHFRKEVDGSIYGVETQILFERVLAQINAELDAGKEVDLILVTGDVSQDGSAESYQRLSGFLQAFGKPCYFLEGNHDYTAPMLEVFGGQQKVSPCVVDDSITSPVGWNIIMLNSAVENEVNGHFGQDQLDFLQESLAAASDVPTLVCFHHHPMTINCEWLDHQVIADADAFFAVMDQYSNVKLCIYGHVHQDRKDVRNQVPYYATPSTCAQFKPEMDDFALDDQAPGYRWIRCFDDGSYETEVVRLKSE